jgi:hypothetical protein
MIAEFVGSLREEEFWGVPKLKIKVLDFVVRKRVVRDVEFEEMYRTMAEKFPLHEPTVKNILVEILTALDE